MAEQLVLVADSFGVASSYTVKTGQPVVLQAVTAKLSLTPGSGDAIPVLRIFSPGGALIAQIQAPTMQML